jgi:hypothetical protein
MSKIVKKKDLDVLIESTLKKAGIETPKAEVKKVVTETTVKAEVIKETPKEVISEDFKRELANFNKLTNYTYKK